MHQSFIIIQIFLTYVIRKSTLGYNLFVGVHVLFWWLKLDCMNIQAHYFWPLDGIAVKQFEKTWWEVTNQLGGHITTHTIPVMFGRYLLI